MFCCTANCGAPQRQDAVAALQEGKAEAVQLEKLRADVVLTRLPVFVAMQNCMSFLHLGGEDGA